MASFPAAPDSAITYPVSGSQRYKIATTSSPPAGTTGKLLSYQVAVETDIVGVDTNAFAAQVSTILSDPRGWTGPGGGWRLRQVASGSQYDFTIYLATPATRDKLCRSAFDQYTSCRNGNSVVLNVARWVRGVPNYGASLDVYRMYLVNHETGHRLGRDHELCPGPGRPAPVMQQQTLGLHGCVAYAWPTIDGQRYSGQLGVYDDAIPRD
jgi:hypothetical protein